MDDQQALGDKKELFLLVHVNKKVVISLKRGLLIDERKNERRDWAVESVPVWRNG